MKEVWPEKTGTLCAQMERGMSNQCVMSATMVVTKIIRGGISATLDASYYKGPGARNGKEREFLAEEHAETGNRKYIVRRLTPLECSRLQGYPDDWSEIRHYEDISDEEQQFWESIRKQHAETYGKAYKPFRTKQRMVNWLNGMRTDSAEYKAYGNSVAVPCVEFVLGGIADLVRREEHAESLP